jgi:hypothetical protein
MEIPFFLNGIFNVADIVKGSRFLYIGGSYDITFLRRLGNCFLTFLVNILFDCRFTDLCYGYIAFKSETIKELIPFLKSEGFAIETEILIKAKKLDFNIKEVPSLELQRIHGESKLNTFKDGIKILSTILKEVNIK